MALRGKAVTIVDKNLVPQLLREYQELKAHDLYVGIKDRLEPFVMMIASVHEYGIKIDVTPKMKAWFRHLDPPIYLKKTQIEIKARSFIRKTFDDDQDKLQRAGIKLSAQVVEGKITAKQAFAALGAIAASLVRQRITHGDPEWEPLKEFSLKRRDETTRAKTGEKNRAKKRLSDTPLNNTGTHIRANIRWWVEPPFD